VSFGYTGYVCGGENYGQRAYDFAQRLERVLQYVQGKIVNYLSHRPSERLLNNAAIQDDILAYPKVAHRTNPDVINEKMPDLKRIAESSHAVIRTVLGALGSKLGLAPGTLENMHRIQEFSGDQFRFIRAPPRLKDMDEKQASLGAHTDFGSVVRYVELPPLLSLERYTQF
jgi:isopenicillin N synthase-like dioxygenase